MKTCEAEGVSLDQNFTSGVQMGMGSFNLVRVGVWLLTIPYETKDYRHIVYQPLLIMILVSLLLTPPVFVVDSRSYSESVGVCWFLW